MQRLTNNETLQPATSSDHQLTIHNYDQFVSREKKKLGSRPGEIGYLAPNQQQRYMLKQEDFAYLSSVTASAQESVAIESLCSKLIRFIFGNQYAANIDLIKLPSPNINPYAVLSLWIEGCETPDNLSMPHEGTLPDVMIPYAIMVTRIQTIAKLINMDDFKTENIVRRLDGSLFLVDCSGLLNGYVNHDSLYKHDWRRTTVKIGHLFLPETATETIKTYLNADFEKIKSIIASYACVLSTATMKKLIDNIEQTRKMCEQLLLTKQSAASMPNPISAARAAAAQPPLPTLFFLSRSNPSDSILNQSPTQSHSSALGF